MNPRRFFKAFQIIGAFVFCAAVFAAILFAEGYLYDPQTHDIVKKGVVYFEGIFPKEKISVLLDGKVTKMFFPGEIRTDPGTHDIEIQSQGFYPWKKRVTVPEDNVLQFKEIRLFPVSSANGSADLYTVNALEHIGSVKSFSDKGIFFVNDSMHFGKYYPLESPNGFSVADLTLKTDFTKLLHVSDNAYFGLSRDNGIFKYSRGKGEDFEWKGFLALDITQVGGRIFALGKNGKIFEIEEGKPDPEVFFDTGEKDAYEFAFTNIARNLFLFRFKTKQGLSAAVAKEDGQMILKENNIGGAYMEEETLYFTRLSSFVVYDLKENKIVKEKELEELVLGMSRIENSFHFLFLTVGNELKYCDEDFENCWLISKTDGALLIHSSGRDVFYAVVDGRLTVFDFGGRAFFRRLLRDFVSGIFGQRS